MNDDADHVDVVGDLTTTTLLLQLTSRATEQHDDNVISQSFEHQESEIKEEVFTPDIEKVEQDRLQVIFKTRSLIRGDVLTQVEVDSNTSNPPNVDHQLFVPHDPGISHQLAAVLADPSLATQQPSPSTDADSNGHDYINQDVIDMALHDTKSSGELLSVNSDEHQFKRVPSSNGYKSQGNPSIRGHRQQPIAPPESTHLGEFEKRLLLAKHKSKAILPNMYKIPWYHPGISRHIAESLLVSRDIKDGTYLLRDCVSEVDTVTLSVRCHDSVKHYRVVWNGKQFIFGLGKFSTLEDFKEHFVHQPIISGDSGILVKLCYPYPRGVSEPAIYIEPTIVTTDTSTNLTSSSTSNKKPCYKPKLVNSMDLSINSKEGYLTKLGYHRKNWKKRWFVLYRNELKYYNSSGDKEPLKVINLEDLIRIDRDDSTCKPNCMRMITSYRTFFMYASSEVEANEWVQILDWRLKQQAKQQELVKQ